MCPVSELQNSEFAMLFSLTPNTKLRTLASALRISTAFTCHLASDTWHLTPS